MTDLLTSFHFMRPLWLLLLPLVLWLWWQVRKEINSNEQTSTAIAAHLLKALTIGDKRVHGFRPVDGAAVLLLIAVIAVAGPVWSKIPSPWFSESAPLVIAVEISDSMRSNDVLPTRMDRARFKILDLVQTRTGARTALIAYAGSAHVVMPPTTDINVIKPFLEGLDPEIMPIPGANPAKVLPLALSLLSEESSRGSILFVADGFNHDEIDGFSSFAASENAPTIAALIFGTEQGGVAIMPDGSPVMDNSGERLQTAVNRSVIDEIADRSGMLVEYATTSDNDLRNLLKGIQSNLLEADDPDAVWRDQSWLFTWPLVLLVLIGFRRGWVLK